MKYYKTKTQSSISETRKFYVIYESLIHSIISDFFTFTIITLAFWFNHEFVGSRLFSVLLFISFFISVSTSFNDKKIELKPEDFIETIKKEILNANE